MTMDDKIKALATDVGTEIKTVRTEIAAGGATLQGELDTLSDVVATKATQSNVDAQLAGKANATDLDNVFGIATAAIPSSQKGAPSGVATLDGDTKIPKTQLPELTANDVGALPDTYVSNYLQSGDGFAGVVADEGGSARMTVANGAIPVEFGVIASPDGRMALIHNGGGTPVDSSAAPNGSGIVLHADLEDYAQQTDLDAKAPLASPSFTGNPTAPTPAPGDNDTSVATTAFVATAVSPKVTGLNGVTGLWKGTQAQYDAIGVKDPNVYYVVLP